MPVRTSVLAAARAEALFISDLSAGVRPGPDEVAGAIRREVRRHGGTRGCAAEVAAEYGDHPEIAVLRMRWAREIVDLTYRAGPPPGRLTRPGRGEPGAGGDHSGCGAPAAGGDRWAGPTARPVFAGVAS